MRTKLSKILFRSIRKDLPSIVQKLESRIAACERLANQLGKEKVQEGEQRQALTAVATQLDKLIVAGLEGTYRDTFFSREHSKLRALLRSTLDDFDVTMRQHGRRFSIGEQIDRLPASKMDLLLAGDAVQESHRTTACHEKDLIEWVNRQIQNNRGREAHGLYSSAVIADVFRSQTAGWQALAKRFANTCFALVQVFVHESVQHVAPPHIASAILENVIKAKLAESRQELMTKIDEILRPYTKQHIFVLNSERLMQKLRDQRVRNETGAGYADTPIFSKDVQAKDTQAQNVEAKDIQAREVLDYVFAQYEVSKCRAVVPDPS